MTRHKGVYISLLAAIISGFSIFINKFAVDAIKQPLVFTSVKNFGVGLLILAILLVTSRWKKIRYLTKKEAFMLMIIGIVGGSLPFYLFFTGLSQVPAVNAAIIQKTLVLWTALLAIPFLKEKLSKLQIIGVIALFVGNLFIGGFKGFTYSSGEMFILIATLLWAVESIFVKKVLAKVDYVIVAAARMGLGSLILLTASYAISARNFGSVGTMSPTQWLWLSLTALSLSAYVLSWYKAVSLAPVTVVAAILVISTLVTNILSALFVTHSWTLVVSPQSFILLFGAFLVYVGSTRNNLDHAL